MKIESQVTSLDLSKRLKELGIKQDSLFYWLINEAICYRGECLPLMGEQWWSAFTASELLELLPESLGKLEEKPFKYFKIYKFKIIKYAQKYKVCYAYSDNEINKIIIKKQDEKLCNALAKMLIHLIENKITEV
jgi:hypothetical protein